MANDYVIARRRIRISGPRSDMEAAGLRSFAPFAAEYDAAAATASVIETGYDPSADELRCTELTRFELEGWGGAECMFGRSGGGKYVLLVEKRDVPPPVAFLFDTAAGRVRSNIGIAEGVDPSAVRFGLWFCAAMALAPHRAMPVHSSAIVCDGRAVLFLGESGTGKSTHTRLWRENIAGSVLLNDDSPFIGMVDGCAMAFGAPWSGKTSCYKNEEYPIAAIVRLSQAPHNAIRRLRGAQAIGAMLPSMPPAFAFDETLQDLVLGTLSEILSQVPVYHLECLPDAAAAHLSHDTVFGA